MSAELDAAIERAKNGAPAAPVPFVVRLSMGEGREAVLTLPGDTTDAELVQIVAVLAGPARVELIGQQARAEASNAGRIVVPSRTILRPV